MKYVILLLLALQLTSCTIEKRLYRSGYHVEWRNSITKHSSDEVVGVEEASSRVTEEFVSETPVNNDGLIQQIAPQTNVVEPVPVSEEQAKIPVKVTKTHQTQQKQVVASVSGDKEDNNQKRNETRVDVMRKSHQSESGAVGKIVGGIAQFFGVILGFLCGLVLAILDMFVFMSQDELPFRDRFRDTRDTRNSSFASSFALGGIIGIYSMLIFILIAAITTALVYVWADLGVAGVIGVVIMVGLLVLLTAAIGNGIGNFFDSRSHR